MNILPSKKKKKKKKTQCMVLGTVSATGVMSQLLNLSYLRTPKASMTTSSKAAAQKPLPEAVFFPGPFSYWGGLACCFGGWSFIGGWRRW